ncbi:MAG: zinc-binding dehydrogenase [Myxococcales bacterium]|nr:zinc-binding dehydrogenase [Myxococcales bacterium]
MASHRTRDPEAFAQDLQHLFRLLQEGEITPVVAEILTLDQVAEAHARLQAGGLTGKLVLDPWV